MTWLTFSTSTVIQGHLATCKKRHSIILPDTLKKGNITIGSNGTYVYMRQITSVSFFLIFPFLAPILIHKFTTPSTSSMSPLSNLDEVASSLLSLNGMRLQSSKCLQSLWAGYGEIARIVAISDNPESTTSVNSQTLIMKLVTPPASKADDEGHTRKILSYQVEQYFYSQLAPQMPASIPVARCLATINQPRPKGASIIAMILSDLRQEFPIAGEKRDALSPTQVSSALAWLSGFHGFWWSQVGNFDPSSLVLPPLEQLRRDDQDTSQQTIWLNGGYTYLATRQKEYANLAHDTDNEWSQKLTQTIDGDNQAIARLVAAFLAPKQHGNSSITDYQTVIHGDVKSENLFTTNSGDQVAFYDFQYVGLGLGVCDLAKLFTCSVPLSMLVADETLPPQLPMQRGERALLMRYLSKLKEESGKEYDWETFVRHWEVALVDWLRFQASWGFWGNTEWLEARGRSILNDEGWRKFVRDGVARSEKVQV
ncbi:hypothetical protein LEMA_P032610.1 [Plenodomus lingam JN3]|uniref:Aminoglycoside phosphotransferase domain-containing protein n=1 Tax=Leptosphaeria maculans (strain JN3 / isolate v23.1.3 / race Av1-4-5-6-7-8) TaxID=985895 RepID=E4ZQB2_LEPMJ|nr:hypothetical protein LEMA_P032610.1 [Plenodomus lingam JN3]CBX93587.1 hypothetical protein LEMA_P032610.1 [Plenodomus lingam JN3]